MYPFMGGPMNFGAMRFGPQQQMPQGMYGQMSQGMPQYGQQMPGPMPSRLTSASLLGMPPSSYMAMYGNQAMPITPTQYAPAARPMLPGGGGGGLLGPAAPAPVPVDPSQRPNFNPNRGGPGDRGGQGPGRGGGRGLGQGGPGRPGGGGGHGGHSGPGGR